MGIRVHKVIGYGLTDLEATDRKITDTRIGSADLVRQAMETDTRTYLEWLEALDPAEDDISRSLDRWSLEDSLQKGENRDLYDSVAYDPEFGAPNVIVFIPPSMRDWRHYDDPIDWVEETYRTDGSAPQAARHRELPHGFYPYNGLYMDTRTGDRIKDNRVMHWIRAVNAGKDEDELDYAAREFGFSTHREAAAFVAPVVPEDVQLLVRFLKVFKDPDDWRSLRPILYTYWS